mmetsp:Transcript_23038/g.72009  ORF Transcript_23038/g.72009 Transcript_23038/m.72009 type:complete len:256 (+) Transcript_23038:393-1160(+)
MRLVAKGGRWRATRGPCCPGPGCALCEESGLCRCALLALEVGVHGLKPVERLKVARLAEHLQEVGRTECKAVVCEGPARLLLEEAVSGEQHGVHVAQREGRDEHTEVAEVRVLVRPEHLRENLQAGHIVRARFRVSARGVRGHVQIARSAQQRVEGFLVRLPVGSPASPRRRSRLGDLTTGQVVRAFSAAASAARLLFEGGSLRAGRLRQALRSGHARALRAGANEARKAHHVADLGDEAAQVVQGRQSCWVRGQ